MFVLLNDLVVLANMDPHIATLCMARFFMWHVWFVNNLYDEAITKLGLNIWGVNAICNHVCGCKYCTCDIHTTHNTNINRHTCTTHTINLHTSK